jgi:hypothetical protein
VQKIPHLGRLAKVTQFVAPRVDEGTQRKDNRATKAASALATFNRFIGALRTETPYWLKTFQLARLVSACDVIGLSLGDLPPPCMAVPPSPVFLSLSWPQPAKVPTPVVCLRNPLVVIDDLVIIPHVIVRIIRVVRPVSNRNVRRAAANYRNR